MLHVRRMHLDDIITGNDKGTHQNAGLSCVEHT